MGSNPAPRPAKQQFASPIGPARSQFFHVMAGKAKPHGPAHRQDDDLRGKRNQTNADDGVNGTRRKITDTGRVDTSGPLSPKATATSAVSMLTAAEGDDERVIDGADSSASFVGIVAASTSTCRSPYERGHPQVVTPGSAAAPLPLLGAARLRCGAACPRSLRAPRAPRRLWLSPRWRRRSPTSASAVVHSSSSWPLSHRRHWEWR